VIPGIGREVQRVEHQMEIPDDRVMDVFAPGAVEAHVMRGPAGTELLAPHRQLSDQVGQGPVVRVAAGFDAEDRHSVVGCALPVEEECAGLRIEKDESGNVDRPRRVAIHLGVQRVAESVRGQDVSAGVAYVCRRVGDHIQDPLHTGPDARLRGATPGAQSGVPGTGQVEQVGPLCLIELQRIGECFQHAFRHPVEVAAFQPGVVVDAHPGEQRNLLPAEPGHPPVTPVGRQTCLVRGDPGPPGDQEVANLIPVVHDHDAICAAVAVGGPVTTWVRGTRAPPSGRMAYPEDTKGGYKSGT
jgi:hypothetical protein